MDIDGTILPLLTSKASDEIITGVDDLQDVHTSCPSSMKVYVRVRPFHQRELHGGVEQPARIVRVGPKEGRITVLDPSKSYAPRIVYSFDGCFDSGTAGTNGDQEVIYKKVGHTVMQNVVHGYNGCIFAYGQTGSGKTHTMFGSRNLISFEQSQEESRNSGCFLSPRVASKKASECLSPSTPSAVIKSSDNSAICDFIDATQFSTEGDGLVPRLVYDIFQSLRQKHKRANTHTFHVDVEYYEIYNEKIFDILNGGNNNVTELRLRHQSTCGAYVEGLTRKHVTDEKEVLQWIRRGNIERHKAWTKMNDCSSRSHAIFTIHIAQMSFNEQGNSSRVSSKLNLVDLAGSERIGSSGVEGKHFKEATKINLSLTALGRVIDALADISAGKRGVFCPYRDSNLTWLLMDSLGGNSKTSMVATISPNVAHYEETGQTLRYASRAKQIVNRAVINDDPQVRQIKALESEVKRLQLLLRERTQTVHKNDNLEQLQDQILKLELDIASRDYTIDGLRSQLVEKNVAELRQLGDENQQLKKEMTNYKQTKSMIAQLQDKLKAATEETNTLRTRIRDLEKQQEMTSRLTVISDRRGKEPTKEMTNACLHLNLGFTTLQRLKSLGIDTTSATTIASLFDTLTLFAINAREKSDEMFQQNVRMIESHSRTLRENMLELEGKEWSVLATAGEKLVASFERARARHEKSFEVQKVKEVDETKRILMSNDPKENVSGWHEEQLRKKDKELDNMSIQLKTAKSRARNEAILVKNLKNENEQLQKQIETVTTEVNRLKGQCEKYEKETRLFLAQEENMKKNLTKTEAMLALADKKMSFLLENNVESFQALYALLTEFCEKRNSIIALEAEGIYALVIQNGELLLQHERHILEQKSSDVQLKCNAAMMEAEAYSSSLQEQIIALRQSNTSQEEHHINYSIRLISMYNCHYDYFFALFCEKTQIMEAFYFLYAAAFFKDQTALLDEITALRHEVEMQTKQSHYLMEQAAERYNEMIRQKNEEIVQTRRLYEQKLQTQLGAQRTEFEIQYDYMDKYLDAVANQFVYALELNKSKTNGIMYEIQEEYNKHINQLRVELENSNFKMTHMREEAELSKEEKHKKQHLIQEQKNTINRLIQEHDQTKTNNTEKQNHIQQIHEEQQKQLHVLLLSNETAKENALKKLSCVTQLVLRYEDFISMQSTLYTEYIDVLLTRITPALEELHASHVVAMEQRVTEAERSHGEELNKLQREHALEVSTLERKTEISKMVIERQREEANREKAVLCKTHNDQLSCLVNLSCTLVAEIAASRQAIVQEEECARVELAVALRHSEMQSVHCGAMYRQLVDGHASFAAHCVAEHAAWVEGLCEVAAAVGGATQRHLQEWQESEQVVLQRAAQQQQDARQVHELHVQTLLGQLGFMENWVGALCSTVSGAVEELHASHVVAMEQRVTEAERSHGEELNKLQREHALEVSTLERKTEISKMVIERQREEANREKAVLCKTHNDQLSCLVNLSCTLVAEIAASRQAIVQEEECARVELAVALRHSEMQSVHCGAMYRQLVDGHASFAAHCVAEHAAWVEGLCEVAAAVGGATQRHLQEWQESEQVVLQRAAQQQQDARQVHELHVQTLLGQLGFMENWVGALCSTVSGAVEELHASHVVAMEQRVTEAERSHGEELNKLQREHALEVSTLERKTEISKMVIERQREEANREKAVLCKTHNDQLSCLVNLSCTLVAEIAASRQAIVQEEECARVELAVALRHSEMQSVHCGAMYRQLVDGHASFAAHCVAEHAAWVEGLCEVAAAVGGATQRHLQEWNNKLIEESMKLENKCRYGINASEESERYLLSVFLETSYLLVEETNVIVREMFDATKALLFEEIEMGDTVCAIVPSVPSISNYLRAMSLLEQYKQCAFEEFFIYLSNLGDLRRTYSVDSTVIILRQEYEMKLAAVEADFLREIHLLQKEEAEIKTYVDKVREISEFGANLDLLEKSVLQKAQQDSLQHFDNPNIVRHGWNDKSGLASQRHQSTRIGGFLSSIFTGFLSKAADVTSADIDASGFFPLEGNVESIETCRGNLSPTRTPPRQLSMLSTSFDMSKPSLTSNSALRRNSALPSVKMPHKKVGLQPGTESLYGGNLYN